MKAVCRVIQVYKLSLIIGNILSLPLLARLGGSFQIQMMEFAQNKKEMLECWIKRLELFESKHIFGAVMGQQYCWFWCGC